MKNCKRCGVTKPLADFTEHPQMKDGHVNLCKSCHNKRMSEKIHDRKRHTQEDMREIFRMEELRQIKVPAELVSKIYTLPDGMSPTKMAAELGCPADYVKAVLLQSMRTGA